MVQQTSSGTSVEIRSDEKEAAGSVANTTADQKPSAIAIERAAGEKHEERADGVENRRRRPHAPFGVAANLSGERG